MPYIIAILVVVVVGVGFTLFQVNKSNAPSPEPTPISETVSEVIPAHNFKDGAYTSKVTYLTPQKTEYALGVTLTLKDDVVTDANVVYSQGAEKDPNPQHFEAAYKTEVIGKSLQSISLSRVGGASLTTAAFNKALVEIKDQAKS